MAAPVGIAVAYGADALAETPTWTRLDATTGIAVQSWSSHRGRAYLSDRTDAGSATINFSDQVGALDPTNGAGPFFPMDPNCPAAIALQHAVTGAWTTVFRGQIQDSPAVFWDGARRNTGSLPLADLFSLFANAELPLDSGGNNTTLAAVSGVDTRIEGLLTAYGVPSGLMNIFSGNVGLQETIYPAGTKYLAALQDCADAEFPGVANLFIGKDGVVNFRGRLARFNYADYGANTYNVGDAAAASAHSSWAAISGLKVGRDIAKVINNALFSPKGIGTADIAGQLAADAGSIAKYGSRSLSGQDLLIAHDNLLDVKANEACRTFGQFYVDNFKEVETRVIQAVFRWLHPSHPNATAQWNLLTGVEIGDVIEVTTTHLASGGFAAAPYFVEGISYDAQLGMRGIWDLTMTLDLSPLAYYANSEGWT